MSEKPYVPYGEFPYTVLLGFREDPGPSIYTKFDALAAEVLEERLCAVGGVVERMPWWKYWPWRLLWRLGIKLGTRSREV